MRSPAAVTTITLLCGCGRPLGDAEVGGEQVEYLFLLRDGQPPLATREHVGPVLRGSVSMQDVTDWLAAFRAWNTKAGERWTVVIAKHRGMYRACRATTRIREERLTAKVLAAVAAGETSVTVG
jgi:hypothetical protein